MLKFEVNIIGRTRISRALKGVEGILTDMKPILERIAADFYETMKKRFDAEGGFEGQPNWEPLSPGYRGAKEFQFPGTKILERSGDLRASITTPDSPYSIFNVTSDNLEIGSSLTVGKGLNLLELHSKGYYRPPVFAKNAPALSFYIGGNHRVYCKSVKGVDVPARPVVEISEAQKIRWNHIIHEELYNRMKDVWGKNQPSYGIS